MKSSFFLVMMVAIACLDTVLAPSLSAVDGEPKVTGPASAPNHSTPTEVNRVPSALEFHRIFVREEQLSDLAREHIPRRREEFEQDLVRFRDRVQRRDLKPVHVQSAEYFAHFDGEQFIDGRARIDIRKLADEKPEYLRLDPLRLPISQPRWQGEGKLPVRFGSNEREEVVVLVEQAGELRFDWTLRGEPRTTGEISFDFHSPPSPRTQLILEVPATYSLAVDHGIVSRVDVESQESWWREKESPLSPLSPIAAGPTTLWRVELGGTPRTTIRCLPPTQIALRSPVTVTQTAKYFVHRAGVELNSECQLHVTGEPLREMRMAVAADLLITEVTMGETALEWQEATDDETSEREITVALREPLTDGTHDMRLSGIVDRPADDEQFSLPTVRFLNGRWESGDALVRVVEPLVPRRLEVTGGRQTKFNELSSPASIETEFQFDAADATITLLTSRRPLTYQLDALSWLNWDTTGLTCRYVANVMATQGILSEQTFSLAPEWIIDSVELSAEEQLLNFEVVTPPGTSERQLRIRFRQPLRPHRPLRITVTGHRRRPTENAAEPYTNLRMLGCSNLLPGRRLVALQSAIAGRIELTGDSQTRRIAMSSLTTTERELLAGKSPVTIFEDDRGTNDLQVQFRRESPAFSAQLAATLVVSPQSTRAIYDIRCTTRSVPLTRFHVLFSEAITGDLAWEMVGGEPSQLTTRRLTTEQKEIHGAMNGDIWEVSLNTPQTAPVMLRATTTLTFKKELSLPLPEIVEATSQTATVTAMAVACQARVEVEQAKAVPLAFDEISRGQMALGKYRYDSGKNARVVVKNEGGAAVTPLWAWSCDVTTQLATAGPSQQSFLFRLENHGASDFVVTLPEGSTANRLLIDGNELFISENQSRLVIPLPPADRFVTVQIDTRHTFAISSWRNRISPPNVTTSLPILETNWSFWLPPEHQLVFDGEPAGPKEKFDWQQRLLGPFQLATKNRESVRFRPDDWLHFLWPSFANTSDRNEATDSLVRSLGVALRDVVTKRDSTNWTWSELLTELAAARAAVADDSESQGAVYVDHVALAQSEVFANTLLPFANNVSQDTLLVGRELLEKFDVALVESNGSLVFTTAAQAETVESAAATLTYLPAERWSQLSQPKIWTKLHGLSAVRLQRAGWNTFRSSGTSTETSFVTVYQAAIIRAWGYVALLLTAGCGWWLAQRRPQWLLLCIGLIAISLLLVPNSFVPVLQGIWGGALLAALLYLTTLWVFPLRSHFSQQEEPAASTVAHVAIAPIAGLLLLAGVTAAFLTSTRQRVMAADSPPLPFPAPNSSFKVLFPVDDDKQPVGDYVYVPRELDRWLRGALQPTQIETGRWLIQNARYRILGSDRELMNSAATVEIVADLELETFAANCHVQFPWGGTEQPWLIDQATLQDKPLDVEWDEQRQAVSFVIANTGHATVRLRMKSRPISRGEELSLKLRIPRVANARVESLVPTIISPRTVISASGTEPKNESNNVIELGPVSTLWLKWRNSTKTNSTETAPQAEHFSWLKLRPNSVVMENKITITPLPDQPLEQFTLAVDPRLRLLPTSPDSPLASVDTLAGNPTTLQCRFTEPQQQSVRLNLSFLLPDSSGLGQLSFPNVYLTDCRTTRRWGAVSVAEPFEMKRGGAEIHERIEPAAFSQAWASADEPPQLAFSLTPNNVPALPPIQHRPIVTHADYLYDIVVDQHQATLRLDMLLDTQHGGRWQYVLHGSQHLHVSSVSLVGYDMDYGVTWSQDVNGDVLILLDSPISGPHSLKLTGIVSPTKLRHLTIPRLRMADTLTKSASARFFRQPNVQVTVTPATGFQTKITDTLATYVEERGRHLTTLVRNDGVRDEAESLAEVVTAKNQPTVLGQTLIGWERAPDGCVVDFRAQLRVIGGVCDTFRLEVPNELLEVVTTEGDIVCTPITVPFQTNQQVLIHPARSVTGELGFAIRLKIRTAVGDTDSVPDVTLLDHSNLERFVALPTQIQGRQVDWNTSGLQRVTNDSFANADFSPTDVLMYRVLGRRLVARLRDVEPTARSPRVWLADIRVRQRADGSYSGLAAFDFQSAGQLTCRFQVPPQCHLLQTSVDGITRVPRPRDKEWEVELLSGEWPQRVEFIFECDNVADDKVPSAQQWSAPWLVNVPVEKTLWSALPANGTRIAIRTTEMQPLAPLAADKLRLEALRESVNLAADAIDADLPEETADWLQARSGLFASLQSRWQIPEHSDGVSQENDLLQQLLHAFAPSPRITLRPTSQRALLAADLRTFPIQYSVAGRSPIICAQSTGGISKLTGTIKVTQPSDLPFRFLLALVVTLILGLVASVARWAVVRELLCQWPHAVAVLCGLVWSLFLTPAWIGWLVVACAVWGSLRSPWPPLPRTDA